MLWRQYRAVSWLAAWSDAVGGGTKTPDSDDKIHVSCRVRVHVHVGTCPTTAYPATADGKKSAPVIQASPLSRTSKDEVIIVVDNPPPPPRP